MLFIKIKNLKRFFLKQKILLLFYKYRGILLGIFGILLLLSEPTKNDFSVSGLFLILIGICIRICARRSIGSHSRKNKLDAPFLITSGIYSVVRHPLYLSNGLICSGFILLHLHWQTYTFYFAFALWTFLGILILNEDLFLQKKFGEEWNIYAKRTPAVFPAFPLKVKSFVFQKSIFQSFCSDLWTWFFILLYAILLVLRRAF